ncbi:MAG: GtrA family protein [Lachnospiraceae bacterium]|nr:GtrA family protein [Lachnospiraceae bacterium]
MKKTIRSLCNNAVIRYIFFGGLATLVNLGVYYILRTAFNMNLLLANIFSVATAIVFAYFTNSRFVFHSIADNFHQRFQEFVKFVSARLSTMVIEIGGVWFLAEVIHMNDMIGKLIIQFVVLALNYLFSKFLVFTKNGAKE